MTTIIDKITRSRNTVLEISNDYDWNILDVPVLSNNEIDKIYNIENYKNSIYASFGIAAGCNFKLKHKQIPSHHLHVIYYNMPSGNQQSVKVTKSLIDKVMNLYNDSIINIDDSLLILINEPISDTIKKINDSLNILLQENYEGPNEQIQEEMKVSKINLLKNFFRYITIFDIKWYQVNLLNHTLVPKHIPIRDKSMIDKIINECNATSSQMPGIVKNDSIAKAIRLNVGDLCKIVDHTRNAGDIIRYRICK